MNLMFHGLAWRARVRLGARARAKAPQRRIQSITFTAHFFAVSWYRGFAAHTFAYWGYGSSRLTFFVSLVWTLAVDFW